MRKFWTSEPQSNIIIILVIMMRKKTCRFIMKKMWIGPSREENRVFVHFFDLLMRSIRRLIEILLFATTYMLVRNIFVSIIILSIIHVLWFKSRAISASWRSLQWSRGERRNGAQIFLILSQDEKHTWVKKITIIPSWDFTREAYNHTF